MNNYHTNDHLEGIRLALDVPGRSHRGENLAQSRGAVVVVDGGVPPGGRLLQYVQLLYDVVHTQLTEASSTASMANLNVTNNRIKTSSTEDMTEIETSLLRTTMSKLSPLKIRQRNLSTCTANNDVKTFAIENTTKKPQYCEQPCQNFLH